MALNNLIEGFTMGRYFLSSETENERAIVNGKLSSIENLEEYWLKIDVQPISEKVGFVAGMVTKAPVAFAVGLYEMVRHNYL